jgi:LPS export ABC transporter permease LptG/LPS export ABC transporter permease LptF
MRIIDRYVIRQVLMPFCMGLMVFTFLLIIPNLLRYGEQFVARGVSVPVIGRLMWTLIPQAIALSIPMSLLLGLLVAFGRLSADREFVALQACGVSLLRLLRPLILLAVVTFTWTAYVMIISLPAANQTFRDITFRVLSEAAEGEVKPRVFFDRFPDVELYVRDVPQAGGWDGVFMADTRPNQPATIHVARHGRAVIDRDKQTVTLVLEDATDHSVDASGKYAIGRSARLLLTIDPSRLFPSSGPLKGDNERTIPELQARILELRSQGQSPHGPIFALNDKFAIPAACFVFALIGLALGATNSRDGVFGSFVLGVGVVIAHYLIMYGAKSLARGGHFPAALASWLPDIVLGAVGIALFVWRDRVADRPIRFTVPARLRRPRKPAAVASTHRSRGTSLVRILDRYVAGTYLRTFVLSCVSLLALFQISLFIDRSAAVFKGDVTWRVLAEHMWYMTPQYTYYVIPLSVLLAALVTVSLLTKSSELIVMKACGISLYRVAVPMLVSAIVAGGALFALDSTVLGEANHQAEYRAHLMRGGTPDSFEIASRHWAIGANRVLYHYDAFNPRTKQLTGLDVYEFSPDMSRLTRRTHVERADFMPLPGDGEDEGNTWRAINGWTGEFTANDQVTLMPFADSRQRFETPSYFGTEQPEPDYMTYAELRRHTEQLRSAGFNVLKEQVALARKVSFPFVTLIMTLIAVPFAVTTGRSGAMAGVAIGIALAITYWTATSVFGALGAGGLVPPLLAAWAPNMIFGAGAIYLLLTVRT